MKIDVALLPGQHYNASNSVCIVVDVLRASSTITTLLGRGCPEVVPAANVAEARHLGALLSDHILCGEEGGLPPEGFAYGNSPSEFARLDLAGRSVILATSNGTRVLAAVAAESPAVLVGCLLNRTAVARAAIEIAQQRDLDITIICSAAHGGATFVLEDALGAGAIADACSSVIPAEAGIHDASAASLQSTPIELTDSARFARDAFTVASKDIEAAVRSAYHSEELVQIGLAEDVAYCARLDTCSVAPKLERTEADGFRLR